MHFFFHECVFVNPQGLAPKIDSLASEEILRLQEQNHTLRAVVSQMRKEMESLSHVQLHPQTETQASSVPSVQHPGSRAHSAHTQMDSGPPARSTVSSAGEVSTPNAGKYFT